MIAFFSCPFTIIYIYILFTAKEMIDKANLLLKFAALTKTPTVSRCTKMSKPRKAGTRRVANNDLLKRVCSFLISLSLFPTKELERTNFKLIQGIKYCGHGLHFMLPQIAGLFYSIFISAPI